MWLDELRRIKENSGLTTKEIALSSGIPEPTLEKIFSGATRDPKLTTIQQLVHSLGSTLDDLTPEYKTPTAEPQGLSKEESELIKFYRQCPPEDQSALLRIAGYISQATSPEHERSYEERVMAARSSIERLAAEDEQARSQLKSQEVVG